MKTNLYDEKWPLRPLTVFPLPPFWHMALMSSSLCLWEHIATEVPWGFLLNYGLEFDYSGPTTSSEFMQQTIFMSLELCFRMVGITTPTQTSDVHQWGLIKKTHGYSTCGWFHDVWTTVVLVISSPTYVYLHFIVLSPLRNDLSLLYTMHACLIAPFKTPIPCTAAAHMAATRCCRSSYATLEMRDTLSCPSLLSLSPLYGNVNSGRSWLTQSNKPDAPTSIELPLKIIQTNGDMEPSQSFSRACSAFVLHIPRRLNLAYLPKLLELAAVISSRWLDTQFC